MYVHVHVAFAVQHIFINLTQTLQSLVLTDVKHRRHSVSITLWKCQLVNV